MSSETTRQRVTVQRYRQPAETTRKPPEKNGFPTPTPSPRVTDAPTRRDVLAATATASAGLLAGCLDGGPFDLGGTEYSGDLVVQNLMDEANRYRLTVTEVSGEGERTVLDARYRVPAATALVYGDVISAEGEYRFSLELLDDDPRSEEWSATVEGCEGDERMNVTISINRDQFNMTPYRCGQPVNLGDGTDVEATDASEYALNGTAGNGSG